MLWDPDDVLVYINKATQDFINTLGATISIGIKFEDFTKNLLNIKSFSEEHYQRRKTTRQLARETNIPQDFTLKSPNGNWVQVKDTPISNGYILQFNTDISSQKTIELELAENKERYSATMEALSGFAYEWDALKDEILFSEDVQNLNLPKKLISSKGPHGKRIDFIAQELNLEANTMGSKSTDIPSSRRALDLKILIEQIREQTQNIE